MEKAGFSGSTTTEGVAQIRSAAAGISTALGVARERTRWAGHRPMTPDMLPIIGPDPQAPSLIYACGHGRNGILLGPLTGRCVVALAVGIRGGSERICAGSVQRVMQRSFPRDW